MQISTTACERLFALLRIKSISADPAFAAECKTAADHLAKDIATLGFATEVRPTAGHPAIVAKSNGKSNGKGGRPHVLFYGHYDVQPVDPLNLWHRPPVRTRHYRSRGWTKNHRRARRRGRQGPVDDLRRGLPGLEDGDGFAAGRRHHRDRRRRGSRIEKFRSVS